MNKIVFTFFVFFLPVLFCDLLAQSVNRKILIFYKTAKYKHLSIPAGVEAIRKLGVENKFQTDTSSDASLFTTENLKKYKAVVFLSTSGDMLNDEQQKAFETYIQTGGGYMGIHEHQQVNTIGHGMADLWAIFDGHPVQQYATFRVADKRHPSTRHLPLRWNIKEEIYNFKNISSDIKVLITVDESSYNGGTNGTFHPMAWYRDFEGGRSFYTALGHADDKYTNPLFLKHILEGIRYAMGK